MMSLYAGAGGAAGDPTAPLGWHAPKVSRSASVKSSVRLNLQSIVCSELARCHAIINQRSLSVGEIIAGHRVQEIDSEGVWLVKQNRRIRLSLFPNVVIQ